MSGALFSCLLLAACGPSPAQNTPLPTPTLIPATQTPTVTPVVPTATSPPRTDPNALQQPPTLAPVLVPAAVQGVVALATTDLARSLDIPREAVTVVEIQAATWHTVDYGCGDDRLPGAGDLEIPGYRLVLAAGGGTYAYHTDDRATVRRCVRSDSVVGETQALLAADPVAAELAALAQRRVASQNDVSPGDTRVESVRSYRWPDASLGCPLPDVTYDPVQIDGYRIVVVVGDERSVFHTNFEQLVPCSPENEQLPPAVR